MGSATVPEGPKPRPRRKGMVISGRQGHGGLVLVGAVRGPAPRGRDHPRRLRDLPEFPRAGAGSGFGGLSAYHDVVTEFQFVGTLANIGLVMAVWLPFMIIGVVGLALLLHGRRSRLVGGLRFIYYLPGALAGMGNFVLWLFLLDPVDSPIRPLLSWLGYSTLDQTAEPAHLPVIFALMLFFQGAGTWILIIYGGLNGISDEVQEAAIVDGATGWQLTRRIKLPLYPPVDRLPHPPEHCICDSALPRAAGPGPCH